MISSVLLSCAINLGALAGDGTATNPSDLGVYKSAAAGAGHDAAAHVRLALWCEAHKLSAEEIKHLALAILYDPTNALARGLLGLVGHQGQWDRPEVAGERIQNDPAHQALVREYLDRRVRTAHKADARMKLAAWCNEKGLKEQALAHYNEVIRLDPSREAAWKHLGYKRQGNRWAMPQELAAEKQEAARQKQADKHWKAKLEKLRGDLQSKDAGKRARAEQGLAEVTDPRAVPMIWALFVGGNERQQIAAVKMLGQIDGPSASNGLAALAVFSPRPAVRVRATATLAHRDPRDVVGRLIAMIHKPFKYQVRPVNGPGLPGELFVEGERFNIQRFYQNLTITPALNLGRFYTPSVPFDPFSARNLMMATLGAQYASAYAYHPGQALGPGGTASEFPVSMPAPVMPHNAAQAGQAIAANPQNAPAIVNQLTTDPANRSAPPAYLFMLMNQHNSANPMHSAMTLAHQDKVANNPANRDANAAFDIMLMAQASAAQQDIWIGLELERIRQSNQNLEQRLAMDVQMVDATNDRIGLYNDRALPVLRGITGLDLGAEPEKWKSWWTDQLGYAYKSDLPQTKPTYTDFVTDPVPVVGHSACFAAGTLVRTMDGSRPIESIQTGDRVLSQGTSTGTLAFQPVVATHRNQPAPTLRIAAGGESIVATGIHRFWKAGKGWTMARELKAGDRLRMVGGVVEIESIQTDKTQPVYNLDVAEDRDFFVGTKGLLVHDFTFVQPVLDPFDRQPDLAALAPSGAR